jgi:hypothetical protein
MTAKVTTPHKVRRTRLGILRGLRAYLYIYWQRMVNDDSYNHFTTVYWSWVDEWPYV